LIRRRAFDRRRQQGVDRHDADAPARRRLDERRRQRQAVGNPDFVDRFRGEDGLTPVDEQAMGRNCDHLCGAVRATGRRGARHRPARSDHVVQDDRGSTLDVAGEHLASHLAEVPH